MEREQEKHGSSVLSRRLSRRNFLALMGAGLVCAASRNDSPGEVQASPIDSELELQGLKVLLDANGLPTKALLPDGSQIEFLQQAAQDARQNAITLQEPEAFTYISFPGSEFAPYDYEGEREHPLVEDLPEDAVSTEELERRGIRIIQGEQTFLHIREGAFEKEGLLGDHAEGSDKKLLIVLVDGPRVLPEYVTDEKYSEVRHLVDLFVVTKEVTEQRRAESLRDFANSLENYREEYRQVREGSLKLNLANGGDPVQFAADNVLMIKSFMLARSDSSNDYIFSLDQSPSGAFFPSEISQISDTSVIFLAVGMAPRREEVVVYFDQNGQCRLLDFRVRYHWGVGEDSAPKIWDTHPEPSIWMRLGYSKDLASYAYADERIGFGLRHEMVHREVHENPSPEDQHTEAEADLRAMESIKEAWERWEKSSFTDDSGYYFVFKNREDSGYILTMGDSPPQKTRLS